MFVFGCVVGGELSMKRLEVVHFSRCPFCDAVYPQIGDSLRCESCRKFGDTRLDIYDLFSGEDFGEDDE